MSRHYLSERNKNGEQTNGMIAMGGATSERPQERTAE